MVFCLVCSRHFKTHSHKGKEDLRDVFKGALCSLIYKYNEFRDISKIYKEFLQKFNLSYRAAGFRNLEEVLGSLKENVIVKENKFVKGYENFYPVEKEIEMDFEFPSRVDGHVNPH